MNHYTGLSLLLALGILFANGCGQVEDDRFPLKVSLFRWVPNEESLAEWIENDFESKNPNIDLVVRPMAKAEDEDLSYDFEKTAAALTGNGPDSQHLVEVDTVILDTLIDTGAVQPFEVGGDVSFLPAAIEAVTWENRVYGVPHWTCGFFIISRLDEVPQAQGLSELLSTLEADGTSGLDLVGDLDGSWNSIMVYLDAFRDTYPAGNMAAALVQETLDPSVRDGLERVGQACTSEETNYCSGNEDDIGEFARGAADALIGYSERLHPILRQGGVTKDELHVASATLGEGDQPMLFTDALVLSRNCTTQRCLDAAAAFASYYVSDEVFEVLLMSQDAGDSAVPRYLLPSTVSAFKFGMVGADRLYGQLRRELEGAGAFPNRGVAEAREAGVIRARLQQALGFE